MTDEAQTHVFPDRGAGEWVALEDYAAAVTRAEVAEGRFDHLSQQYLFLLRQFNLIMDQRAALQAENERLRAAIETVLIGGNHLVALIPSYAPPSGTSHEVALQWLGAGNSYEAWCCWNAIMAARDLSHG
jgi:hypothetical protein